MSRKDWIGGHTGHSDETGEWVTNEGSWRFVDPTRGFVLDVTSRHFVGLTRRGPRTANRPSGMVLSYEIGPRTWTYADRCDSLASAFRRAEAIIDRLLPEAHRYVWKHPAQVWRFEPETRSFTHVLSSAGWNTDGTLLGPGLFVIVFDPTDPDNRDRPLKPYFVECMEYGGLCGSTTPFKPLEGLTLPSYEVLA